jgi:uncharacterized protein (DUF58 family)
MHTSPRRRTIATAFSGVLLAGLSIATRRPEPALAGAALLTAVAYGRASTRADVARARRAGFEMVWKEQSRRARIAVGQSRVFVAELRNRSDRVVHVDGLRAVAGSGLRAVVRPAELDVLPRGYARIEVEVTGRRVGRHGVHGISLGASGVGAAFDVPLTFANVLGVEVVPRAVASGLGTPRGGRMRADPAAGRARTRKGDGSELREIREIAPGDGFRKIAWKASARRGRLMVRETDLEERDVVWIVLDVSSEGFEGPVGDAPLDRALEVAAAHAVERARHGAAVGIALTTDHLVAMSPPARGGADVDRLAAIWLDAVSPYGADRAGVSVDELLRLVVEHARPLDPAGLGDLPRGDVDRLLARLETLRGRAPFALPPPLASATNESRDRLVRHYAASFGLDVPARGSGQLASLGIADALGKIAAQRPRATDVVVIARAPAVVSDELREASARLRKKGLRPRWATVDPRVGLAAEGGLSALGDALDLELGMLRRRGNVALASAGFRVLSAQRLNVARPSHRYEDVAEPVAGAIEGTRA